LAHILVSFVSERVKAENKVVQNLKSSEMLKDERKETDEMRALVDSWLHAVKKLNFLSEELVSTNSVLFQVLTLSLLTQGQFCLPVDKEDAVDCSKWIKLIKHVV